MMSSLTVEDGDICRGDRYLGLESNGGLKLLDVD
jgi:hypothetical protein